MPLSRKPTPVVCSPRVRPRAVVDRDTVQVDSGQTTENTSTLASNRQQRVQGVKQQPLWRLALNGQDLISYGHVFVSRVGPAWHSPVCSPNQPLRTPCFCLAWQSGHTWSLPFTTIKRRLPLRLYQTHVMVPESLALTSAEEVTFAVLIGGGGDFIQVEEDREKDQPCLLHRSLWLWLCSQHICVIGFL